MADFHTHIGTSTVLGAGYGVWGYSQGAPLETAALGAALCSVSGMLPDLDSDSGVPSRESFAFAAAVVPALMLHRFQRFGWSHEMMAIATIRLYLFVRFGVSAIFKKVTVHRGMWHSIPACFTSGCLAFLICHHQQVTLRIYLAVGVMLGFLSHLLLDELWSINFSTSKVGLKSSWGTALKFFGDSAWGNFVSYALLFISAAAALGDPMLMEKYGYETPYTTKEVQEKYRRIIEEQLKNARSLLPPANQPWR